MKDSHKILCFKHEKLAYLLYIYGNLVKIPPSKCDLTKTKLLKNRNDSNDTGFEKVQGDTKMAVNNNFLINLLAHDNVVNNCFCNNCRTKRLSDLDGINLDVLYLRFTGLLPLGEEDKLDKYHGYVLEQIVYGEKYKQSALGGTGYTYFKCWAKQEYPNLSAKELTKFSDKVNEASNVYLSVFSY